MEWIGLYWVQFRVLEKLFVEERLLFVQVCPMPRRWEGWRPQAGAEKLVISSYCNYIYGSCLFSLPACAHILGHLCKSSPKQKLFTSLQLLPNFFLRVLTSVVCLVARRARLRGTLTARQTKRRQSLGERRLFTNTFWTPKSTFQEPRWCLQDWKSQRSVLIWLHSLSSRLHDLLATQIYDLTSPVAAGVNKSYFLAGRDRAISLIILIWQI